MSAKLPLFEREILIQLQRPNNNNIIQIYPQTADQPKEEVDDFYKQLDQVLKLTKTNGINIILVDFIATAGKGRMG